VTRLDLPAATERALFEALLPDWGSRPQALTGLLAQIGERMAAGGGWLTILRVPDGGTAVTFHSEGQPAALRAGAAGTDGGSIDGMSVGALLREADAAIAAAGRGAVQFDDPKLAMARAVLALLTGTPADTPGGAGGVGRIAEADAPIVFHDDSGAVLTLVQLPAAGAARFAVSTTQAAAGAVSISA
jgi:hypothetical protein